MISKSGVYLQVTCGISIGFWTLLRNVCHSVPCDTNKPLCFGPVPFVASSIFLYNIAENPVRKGVVPADLKNSSVKSGQNILQTNYISYVNKITLYFTKIKRNYS